jgi:5,10-methylenetetrahydrofolate reductase
MAASRVSRCTTTPRTLAASYLRRLRKLSGRRTKALRRVIRKHFDLGVAAYLEAHPEAKTLDFYPISTKTYRKRLEHGRLSPQSQEWRG